MTNVETSPFAARPRDGARTSKDAADADAPPIYLFRVARLVFEPFEALAGLGIALLAQPSRVLRLRFVVDADVSRTRRRLVTAVLASCGASVAAEDIPFAAVVVGANQDRSGTAPPLVRLARQTFAWLGLDVDDAAPERDTLAFAATLDDDERSLRGELGLIVMRSSTSSHVFFFDDGARELLLVSVPLGGTEEAWRTGLDPDLEARLDALLGSRSRLARELGS